MFGIKRTEKKIMYLPVEEKVCFYTFYNQANWQHTQRIYRKQKR